jgi:hypothetical protein
MNLHGAMICPQGTSEEVPETIYSNDPADPNCPVEEVVETCGVGATVLVYQNCSKTHPCLHDGLNNNLCFQKMNLHGNMMCPQGTSEEEPSIPVATTTEANRKCTTNTPCLHDGINDNTCYPKLNNHGHIVCPMGTT